MRPTVFVCQSSVNQDYSGLYGYGVPREIATRSIYPDEVDERTTYIVKWAHDLLRDFDPHRDFIALSGDPLIIGIVTTLAVARALTLGNSFIRLLKWDGQEKAYYVAVFRFPPDIGDLNALSSKVAQPG